ncbi:hypothetical protein [uncultured Friedmanniella sp.]|uniref:hypothetical protein n=1 Tax=uncultured Friedmanniella sp. TaxID=335381 RepID=UPI0035CBC4C2
MRPDTRSAAAEWTEDDPPFGSFTLEIGLEDFGGGQEDVRAGIDDLLDGFGASSRQDPGGPVILTLTVPAADLWLSLLLAMAAVTRIGYSPRSVQAMPTGDFEHHRSRPAGRRPAWSQGAEVS